ncbi:MAG TPA: RNA polymerase sigma factor [Baekduia sp.]|uniref:RNA polymerase sigma factor n=1 Tax=Baekduia sp. TaxID=2600305 RepID=UPI002D776F68|nr:RNA polymerase sigma factor [Baekduia sp.]HET6508583.1 RNA polymerase sigma factor [Baekduia sp.]
MDATPLTDSLTRAPGFVALYRRESPMLLTFCARRVLDAETALDLVAETFAQAFRSRGSFKGSTEEEARAWLLTIARRQIARYLDRGRLDRRLVERVGFQVPAMAPDEIADVERRAGLSALRGALGAELAKLSGDQREALRLRVVEELSYAQVARSLGITEATARARVSRGLRALSRALEPHHHVLVNGGEDR